MLVLGLGLVLKDNFRVLGIGLETQVVGLVLVLECQILGLETQVVGLGLVLECQILGLGLETQVLGLGLAASPCNCP